MVVTVRQTVRLGIFGVMAMGSKNGRPSLERPQPTLANPSAWIPEPQYTNTIMAPSNDVDLYSLLKVDRGATEEDIHRSYKTLSTTFHPDKLPPTTSAEDRERIQEVFLEFKRANDILVDPVLRLAYDHYGDQGVNLIRRIQQQRKEEQNRRDATPETTNENGNDSDNEDDEDDDDADANLYERIERLLQTNPLEAQRELQRFMEHHDYHERLMDHNHVQLACSMDFPPLIDLKSTFFHGRDYLRLAKQQIMTDARQRSPQDRQYYQQRLKQEQGLVDYQINRIRDSQKGSVGFTLSSVQPGSVNTMTGTKVQPKWSMAVGASTDLVYPGVAEIVELVGKEKEEESHRASMFVNAVYQPLPDSQINLTANLTNDQSHQFVVGSARTFSNRSSCRYSMTFLSKSPMDTNIVLNLKTFRHIKNLGIASSGLSMGANGRFLNWDAKLEAVNGKENIHKTSAKVMIGMMQGTSLELAYKLRARKRVWLDDYMVLPKSVEAVTVLGRFPKVEATVVQEITTLAARPTLAFGFEHDIGLGCWTWVWELTYHNSTFRVPVPVLHLGTVLSPTQYYRHKFFHGIYCTLLQSLVVDILQDDKEEKSQSYEKEKEQEMIKLMEDASKAKTKMDATRQLELMRSVAERRRYVEMKRDGLVILAAEYYLEDRTGPEFQRVVMNATVQLQFWVANGRLNLPALPKSALLGFYDLRTDMKSYASKAPTWDWRIWKRWSRRSSNSAERQPLMPHLTIRYSYQGYVYEIECCDDQALNIPCNKARLLGHSSVVQ